MAARNRYQTTLLCSSAPVTGLQLDRDQFSTVRFYPAPPNAGVIFVRNDLPGKPHVSCRLDCVRVDSRWSSLEQNGVEVHHTEHLLAAIWGCGVDNVLVGLDSDRIPIVDGGSCKEFCAALDQAGRLTYEVPRQVYRLTQPVFMEAPLETPSNAFINDKRLARRYIVGIPADDLSISYVFQITGAEDTLLGLAEYDKARHSFKEKLGGLGPTFLNSKSTNCRVVCRRSKTISLYWARTAIKGRSTKSQGTRLWI